MSPPPPATWRSTRTTTRSIQYFGEDSQFGKFLGEIFQGFKRRWPAEAIKIWLKLHVGEVKLHITTIFVGKAKSEIEETASKEIAMLCSSGFLLDGQEWIQAYIYIYIYVCVYYTTLRDSTTILLWYFIISIISDTIKQFTKKWTSPSPLHLSRMPQKGAFQHIWKNWPGKSMKESGLSRQLQNHPHTNHAFTHRF